METFVYIVGGLIAFWFIFGILASKAAKRPYDEDTSIKDGAKSVIWLIVAEAILGIAGFMLHGFKSL